MFESVAVSSSLDSFSDEELLVEYRTFGDVRYFNELIRRYRPALARYLRGRYGLSADQLDDALQATFFRVWEKLGQYDVSKSVRPWIYRIASSQTIDLLRKANRHGVCVSLDAPRFSESSSWSNDLEGNDPDPAEEIERQDLKDQIRLAAEALPSRYRDVVEMVFFKGMTFQNAAHFLNLASATVSRRVSKAIELMSASLLNDRLDVSCERLMRLVEHCESI
ncbi:MAG: sigma-70 family RNA polymerase sigma factor [Thermoguttaceae bacterium]|nr:sigma-70 family RNA polymerase sigma factor [Thermoguttaceae bacterium]